MSPTDLSTNLLRPPRDPFRIVRFISNSTKVKLAHGAAILLTIASLFTTYFGLANFHYHGILAFVTALGIQLLLYISAWMYAEARASRRYLKRLDERDIDESSEIYRQARARAEGAGRFIGGAVVAFSMGVSIFFSFDALFDAVYKPAQQNLNNQRIARTDIGGIAETLRDKVIAAKEEQLGNLKGDEGWRAWETGLGTILATARDARKLLADATSKERAEAEVAQKNAVEDAEKAALEVATLEARLKGLSNATAPAAPTEIAPSMDGDADGLNARIQATERVISDLGQKSADWAAKINEETVAGGVDEKTGKRRKATCGPVCRSYKTEKAAVDAILSARKEELNDLKAQQAGRKAESDQAADKLRKDREGALASQSTLQAQLAAAKTRLDAARAVESQSVDAFKRVMGSSAVSADPADSGGLIEQIQTAKEDFLKYGTKGPMDRMTEGCQTIYNTLAANAATRERIGGFSCNTGAFAGVLGELGRLNESADTLDKRCKVVDLIEIAPSVAGAEPAAQGAGHGAPASAGTPPAAAGDTAPAEQVAGNAAPSVRAPSQADAGTPPAAGGAAPSAQTAAGGASSQTDTVQTLDVKPMIDKARECVGLAALPYDSLKGERATIDRVEQENSPNTSHFERSLSMLVRFDKLAWLAAGIAFVVDFMVLATALIGAASLTTPLYAGNYIATAGDLEHLESVQHAQPVVHRDDPPSIRNQKMLLSALRLEDLGTGSSELVIDLDSPEIQALGPETVRSLAVQLIAFASKGLVRPLARRKAAYALEKSFVEHMASEIGRYEKEWDLRHPGQGPNGEGPSGPTAPSSGSGGPVGPAKTPDWSELARAQTTREEKKPADQVNVEVDNDVSAARMRKWVRA